MGCGVTSDIVHTESGEAVDIETIIRLRSWIEDIVAQYVKFSKTELFTDYDRERQLFGFKIVFIR